MSFYILRIGGYIRPAPHLLHREIWLAVSLPRLSRADGAKNGPTVYDLCDPLLPARAGATRICASSTRPPSPTRCCGRCCRAPACRNCATDRDSTHCATPSSRPAIRHRRTGSPSAGRWPTCSTSFRKPIRCAGPRRPQPKPVRRRRSTASSTPAPAHLLGSFARNGFIPGYAAFNLIGDPDFRGRDLLTALQGLNARAYKNSTLLFNLARAFIAGSPAAAVINPPWSGLAEQMWSPVQIRHRSAYYDAFYAEALMDFLASGLATPQESRRRAPHGRAADRLLPQESREQVPSLLDGAPVRRRHRARAVAARAVQPLLRQHQERPRLRHLRAGLRHHRLLAVGRDAIRLAGRDPRPAADRLLRRLPDRPRRQPRNADGADQRQHRVRRRHRHLDRERQGDRPYGNDLDPTLEPRRAGAVLPQLRPLGASSRRRSGWRQCARSSISSGGWWRAARSPSRARTSIICRSCTAPISAAATRRSACCRARNRTRSIRTRASS